MPVSPRVGSPEERTHVDGELVAWRRQLDIAILRLVSRQSDDPLRTIMLQATDNATRLLGLLTLSCCQAAGGDVLAALNPAAAVEMVHAAALVAQQAAAEGRAGPADLHDKFGAVPVQLSAQALLGVAMEGVARSGLPDFMSISIVLELARTMGGRETTVPTPSLQEPISPGFGSAELCAAAAKTGAIVAFAAPETVEAIGNVARRLPEAHRMPERRDRLLSALCALLSRSNASGLLTEWQHIFRESLDGRGSPSRGENARAQGDMPSH